MFYDRNKGIALPNRFRDKGGNALKNRSKQGGFLLNPSRLSGDPLWSNVVSLLRFNGADGSTATTDETGRSWTFYNDAQISTSSPKFGTGCLLLNGNASIGTSHSSSLDVTSGDWAIETYIKINAFSSGDMVIFDKDGRYGVSFPQYSMQVSSSGILKFIIGSGDGVTSSQTLSASNAISTGSYYHVAGELSGTTLRLFIEGNIEASATKTATITSGGQQLLIGYQTGQPSSSYFNGRIDDFRFTQGASRSTDGFISPGPFKNY